MMTTRTVSFFDVGNDWGFSMTCEVPQGDHSDESQRFNDHDLELFVEAIRTAFGPGACTVK